MKRVILRRPGEADCEEFLVAVRASRRLHRPWVHPPDTTERFRVWARNAETDRQAGFLVCEQASGAIAGVFTLSEIVRGPLQSAYLGFYAFVPFAGAGYMREALTLVISSAFRDLRLHRVEANIQPENARSIGLVKRCGFQKEGFSPRYLRIGGRWRDHERWAIRAEDWRRKRAHAS